MCIWRQKKTNKNNLCFCNFEKLCFTYLFQVGMDQEQPRQTVKQTNNFQWGPYVFSSPLHQSLKPNHKPIEGHSKRRKTAKFLPSLFYTHYRQQQTTWSYVRLFGSQGSHFIFIHQFIISSWVLMKWQITAIQKIFRWPLNATPVTTWLSDVKVQQPGLKPSFLQDNAVRKG